MRSKTLPVSHDDLAPHVSTSTRPVSLLPIDQDFQITDDHMLAISRFPFQDFNSWNTSELGRNGHLIKGHERLSRESYHGTKAP